MPIGSIDVIVPTTGGQDLAALKEALRYQTRAITKLIVVEDRQLRGSAWARNRGVEQSSAELVAFVDDDCIPPREWLEALAVAIDRYGAAGAGGTYDEADPFLRMRRSRQNYPDLELMDGSAWVGAGGNVAYRRGALESLRKRDGHVFNEAFRVAEDKELAWRIRAVGGRLVFVPVRVRHSKRCTAWSYVVEQFGRGTGIAGLHWATRGEGNSIAPDRGRLWAHGARRSLTAWLQIFALKAIGPFDYRTFKTKSDFLLFWIGEKSQGLGFLWGLMCRPFTAGLGRP
jgi:glycosyltransferase involved in cell wall biosynthesis